MRNIEQLLNKENWIKYLELADEGGITNHGIAQDIVSKIEQAINYSRCSAELLAYTEFLRNELHLNVSDTWVDSYFHNSK